MHTSQHHWVIWLMYGLGLVLHVAASANLAVHSKLNAFTGFKHYLRVRLVPILSRGFLSVCLLPLVWDNPKLFDIDRFMTSFAAQWGLAGLLGWFSDSFWDKVLTLIPFLRKEVPVIPPVNGEADVKPI